MATICMTRAIKNIRYIEHAGANVFNKKELKEISALAPEILLNLQTIQPHQLHNKKLADFLRNNPIPRAKTTVSGPLFNGVLVFARVTFNINIANQPPQQVFSANNADIQTAITYATSAVIPIHAYALQYGFNSITVSPNIIQSSVDLTGNTFSDKELAPLTDAIIHDNKLGNACIVFLADTNAPTNTNQPGGINNGYHHVTANGNPFCFCRVGQSLTVDDLNNRYAGILSHEIAEMVVDPQLDGSNPEVCDACFGNCHNTQFNFFDSSNNFIRGSSVVPPGFSYHFFIDGIIKTELIDPNSSQSCVLPGKDATAACIYAPPTVWSGPGLLTTTPNVVSVSGHYSNGDHRDNVIAGTSSGKIHEIFWKSGQAGIEGEDDLPSVSFTPNSIAGVSSLYNTDEKRHLVVVGTTQGKIHEIFWKSDTVGIEGQDDLPNVNFAPGTIVALSGFYNTDDKRHLVVVGTTQGKIHEIFWKSDTVGIEGQDDLPVTFPPNSIKGVAGFYNPSDQRHVVVVGTTSGDVYQIYWKAFTEGVEIHSLIAKFPPNNIVAIGAFYSEDDQFEHVIVGTTDGKLQELWTKSGQVMA